MRQRFNRTFLGGLFMIALGASITQQYLSTQHTTLHPPYSVPQSSRSTSYHGNRFLHWQSALHDIREHASEIDSGIRLLSRGLKDREKDLLNSISEVVRRIYQKTTEHRRGGAQIVTDEEVAVLPMIRDEFQKVMGLFGELSKRSVLNKGDSQNIDRFVGNVVRMIQDIERLEQILIHGDEVVVFDVVFYMKRTLHDIYAARKGSAGRLTVRGPRIDIRARPIDMEILFSNLLTNSMRAIREKFGKGSDEQGKIQVSFRANQWNLITRFRDNGSGIPAEVLRKIGRGEATTTKMNGGGEGLALVKELVEDTYHGTCSIESKEGVGATVTIRLPIVANEEMGQALLREQEAQQAL